MSVFRNYREIQASKLRKLKNLLDMLAKQVTLVSDCVSKEQLEKIMIEQNAGFKISCTYEPKTEEWRLAIGSYHPEDWETIGKVQMADEDIKALNDYLVQTYPGVRCDGLFDLYPDAGTIRIHFSFDADLEDNCFVNDHGVLKLRDAKNNLNVSLEAFAIDLFKIQNPDTAILEWEQAKNVTVFDIINYSIRGEDTGVYSEAAFAIEFGVEPRFRF